MIELKTNCYKGTRITIGNEKREYIDKAIKVLLSHQFTEIDIPIIQYQTIFSSKVGEENGNMMFNFQDAGQRDICLAPEYTAVIQMLAKDVYRYKKDLKCFYVQECFRGEKPQAGRYRQFTQLGVEIINPSKDYTQELIGIAKNLISSAYLPLKVKDADAIYKSIIVNTDVTRGLDYYEEGKGFEISCDLLGAQKQICGGGAYEGGIGFALGVDRLLMINKAYNDSHTKTG